MSDAGDIDDMAKNALHILSKDNLATFKTNALERAKEFDISIVLPKYEEFYESILENYSSKMHSM